MKKTLKTKISVITAFILSIIIFTAYVANAAGAQCITLTGENVVDLGQDCYCVKVPIGSSGQFQYTLNEVDGIKPEGKAVFHNRRQNQNILTLSKDGKYTAKEYGKQRIEYYYINYSRKTLKKRPDLKYNGFPEIYPYREIEIEVVDKNVNSVEEIPFYRLYNQKSVRYVFTRFMTERDRLIKKAIRMRARAGSWQRTRAILP